MYYLPIIINNRKTHICQLETKKQEFVPKFIVNADAGRVPLIRIQHQAKIFADYGINGDLYLEGRWNPKAEHFDNETGIFNAYTLEFIHRVRQSKLTKGALKSIANKKKPFVIEPPIKDAGNYQDIVLSWEGTIKEHSFPVTIRLKIKDETYEYKMEFHVTQPEHIYNVIFDFGSEASQMAFLSKNGNAIKRIELLHQMNKHFFHNKLNERKQYEQLYQVDPDDDSLYVSNFLVKKENDLDLDEFSLPFEKKDDSILHLMIRRADYYNTQDVFERVPNLKLTEFGDFKKFDIILNGEEEPFHEVKDEFYQAILNQFFMLLMKGLNSEKRFAKKKFENWENIPKKIIITLLVPNIYDQQKVTNLIRKSHFSFNELCKVNTTKSEFSKDLKINAVEVQTISESDASFLGFTLDKLRKNLKPNANYMVIDGGKGTLDISVIKVEEDAYNYNGIYRGGIAGAGNVLTYAFLENLATIAVGPNESYRRVFIKKFLNVLVGDQLKLIEYIEILKKRFSSITPISEQEAIGLKSTSGDVLHSPDFWINVADKRSFGKELEDLLKNAVIDKGISLGDYYSIIQKTIDNLTNEAINIIDGLDEYSLKSNRQGEYKKKLELEYVILSGRSFLLKPFRETLIQALVDNAIIASKENVLWDENLAKKSCVEGPLDSPQGINRNTNLVGFPVPESMMINGKVIGKKKSTNRLEDFLGNWFKSSDASIKKSNIFLSEKFFLEGLPARINDVIRVGDVNYNPDRVLKQGNKKNNIADVIFTGEEFKIRSSNGSAKLIPRRARKGSSNLDVFLWKSLFPHVKEADGEDNDSSNIPITDI